MSFELIERNGVKFFRSDILGCPHGFSTRLGGVSEPYYTKSLNLAFGRGDGDEIVLENLDRFANAVGVDPRSVVSRPQIHSSDVRYVCESDRGDGYFSKSGISCDGYVTDRPGVTLGVKTADCVPILLYDPAAEVVGAVHAGWRGTAAGIAAVCVEKMRSLGARPGNIRAAIGAAIRFCCYEVGEDFRNSVESLAGERIAERFIREKDGRLHADVVGMNIELLHESGVTDIDVSERCTCCEPELFFSHRAAMRVSGGLRGTMLAVIALPNVTAV